MRLGWTDIVNEHEELCRSFRHEARQPLQRKSQTFDQAFQQHATIAWHVAVAGESIIQLLPRVENALRRAPVRTRFKTIGKRAQQMRMGVADVWVRRGI